MECYNLATQMRPSYAPEFMLMSIKAETFAQYVRRLRLAADMTQGALAHAANISQSYVSGIERGINVEVDPEIVAGIADALKADRKEALRVASANVGYVATEITRESVIDLSEFEGFDDLAPESREDVMDEIAAAIDRARRRERRRENIGAKIAP